MSKSRSLLVLCLIAVYPLIAASHTAVFLPPDTLAEVGASVITTEDLLERLELMPWPGKERPGWADSVKAMALQSLVAERLLATEATSRGLGADPVSNRRIRTLERVLVRDELYRREILARVRVSRTERERGMRRSAEKVRIVLLTCDSRGDAGQARRLLQQGDAGGKSSSALSEVVRRIDTLSFSFGEVIPELEDAAFGLRKTHSTAGPLQLEPRGWVVLQLIDRSPNEDFSAQPLANRASKVEGIIRRAKETDLTRKYTDSVLSSKRAESDPVAFRRLAGTAWSTLSADSVGYIRRGGYDMSLLADALEPILRPHLDEPLVAMEGEPLLLGDMLEAFRTLQFTFLPGSRADFLAQLNRGIKDIVATEYIAREGLWKNLQHTDAVRRGIATWTAYWNAHSVERLLRDSVTVTDAEIIRHLAERGEPLDPPFEVRVREILADSLETAVRLAERILKGEDFADLARRYSRRGGWAAHGGESPWFRVSAMPDLGFHALAADSGEVVGPVRVRGGYSVFRLLGKRRVGGDSLLTLDSLRALAWKEVFLKKGNRMLNRRIADLARRYGAALYHERLRGVELIPRNIVTRRILGFGGSILAVPPLLPRWQWVLEGRDAEEALP